MKLCSVLCAMALAGTVASAANKVLSLDNGGYVSIPDNPSQATPTAVTIEFWANMSGTTEPGNGRPFQKRHGSGGQFSINFGTIPNWAGGTCGVELFDICNVSNFTFPIETWSHFAVTWSAASQMTKVYVNGIVVAETVTSADPMNQYPGELRFGDGGEFSNWKFQGRLDNIRYWNIDRTPGQITANAARQFSAAEAQATPGLIGSWTFESGDASDATGVNSGSLFNGATVIEDCRASTIAQQPSSAALFPQESAMFVVSATGMNLAYQWQKDSVDLIESDRFVGTTTSALTILNVQSSDQGEYRCVVSGACETAVSSVASLSCKPIIITQPPMHAPQRRTLQLSVGVPDSAPYTYRWQRNGVNLVNTPGTYSGVYTRTLRILSPDFYIGGTFTCELADVCGITLSDESRVCLADFNADDLVDDADFVDFARAYDTLTCDDLAMSAGCPADFNNDTVVDDADFVSFVVAYTELMCP